MPRININEKDRTSPGTPGGYSNNTVLIAGFSAYTDEEIKANAKAVQADDNGIFEFESSDDFVATIGLVAPTIHKTDSTTNTAVNKLPVHYGNQMAYELLKMGYPIIYINLGVPYETVKTTTGTGESATTTTTTTIVAAQKMKDLGNFEKTWEIFKDKASYDFRFVSHGLLTSNDFAKSDDLIKLEQYTAKVEALWNEANADVVRFTELLTLYTSNELNAEELIEYNKFFGTKKVAQKDAEGNEVTDDKGNTVYEDKPELSDDVLARLKNTALTDVKEKESAFVLKSGKLTDEAKAIGYTTQIFKDATDYGAAVTELNKVKAALQTATANEATDTFTDTDFNNANAAIAKLAYYKAVVASDGTEDEMDPTSGRGDCVALVEVDEAKYITKATNKRPENQIVDAINEMADINADNGKYCACTVPSVVYKMTADERFDENTKFPGAFHYLACFDNSLGLGFAEWYAAAGYTRGVSSYVIDHTTVKLGEVAIQALEPRNIKDQAAQPKFAVNVIANFRGSYYLWGNRTCHPLGDAKGGNDLVASHFLNIRQLCTTIKKQLYVSCRRFTFDPNSDVLWINFKNSITPMLDRMKADQGIRDYRIEKIYTDKKATMKARIRIVPIEAVEDFLLEVSLEDSFGETAVTVAE